MGNMLSSPLDPSVQALVTPCEGEFFETFGYEHLDILGTGMSSVVIQSRPPQSQEGEMQAAKMISKDFKSGKERTKIYFETEVSILSKIRHKNVVEMIMAYECPDMYVITMPYYSGGSLTSHLTHMTCKETDKYLLQLTSAVLYIHNSNVAHRDIKPDNILISSDGNAVLSDFGLSRVVKSEQSSFKCFVGTKSYGAPELLHGQPKDKINWYKCDMYSLGLVLWSMVVREQAKKGQTDHLEHLPLQKLNPGSYRHLIENLLVHNPEERWDSNQLALMLWNTWPQMGHDLNQYFVYYSNDDSEYSTGTDSSEMEAPDDTCAAHVGYPYNQEPYETRIQHQEQPLYPVHVFTPQPVYYFAQPATMVHYPVFRHW